VAVGPDGAYYVGMLSGFPFAAGAAAVYRVDPATGRHDPYVTGLNHVVGIGFGPDGTLYVLELAENLLELEVCEAPVPGALLMVKDGVTTVLLDDVPLPGGLVVDAYGAVYLTTNSILPGAGEVWKVTPAE
jgi:sugar lactone lactonase YvrE